MSAKSSLPTNPMHLGLGAAACVEPTFTGEMAWYQAYGERHAADGKEGRLVSMHTFTRSWDTWEMHPMGDEIVVCTKGTIELVQEVDGEERRVTLGEGDAIINPAGVWHTAIVKSECSVLFITAGMGTEMRPVAS